MLRVLKWLVALAFTVAVAVVAVAALATYEELTATLPPIDKLLDYDPPVATRVYAADDTLIEEFFRERRYTVPIDEIPPTVRNAFLAAEDSDFFTHRGVDFVGIARAALANFRAGDVVQGASTITQQVVKALLLTPERSYERKLKEILLSLRLEQTVTKEQILELYLNQIYLGDGNHGVGAAARNYFGKSVQELTIAQAAMLAGLPAAPSRYSPNRDPDAALRRQHYVLRRMAEERFITAGEYQAALREPLEILTQKQKTNSVRNYYTETIRLQLEDMFGAEAPYNQGYAVHTAMQPRLQNLARAAVRNGIERVDLALGYRGPLKHLTDQERRDRLANASVGSHTPTPDPERIYEAVVIGVSPGKLDIAVDAWDASIDVSSLHWYYKVKDRRFRVGDLIEVRTREPGKSVAPEPPKDDAADDDETPGGPEDAKADGSEEATADNAEEAPEPPPLDPNSKPHFYLAQTPEVEAALVAIDIEKGGIAAMIGGYDFLGSQFNRALQAQRQPGSAFKPFIYSAALDNGYTAASILQDTPVEYWDHDKMWQPRNYSRDFKGPIRLRSALEQSRNVVSVKLVDAVGVKSVVDYLSRFRMKAHFGPNLSLGLGTSEMTLRDITEGYTAFANGGVKVEAVTIRSIADKAGNTFFVDEPRRREVLAPETAALMTYILEGVVQRGTATSIRALGRAVAGKTGTTNEQRDAWFMGYTPSLVVGVWVGFDDPNRTMGRMGTGGRVAAPIWLEFMSQALEGQPALDFDMPDNIRCVNIDPGSGRRAGEWTSKPFLECFKAGTEPGSAEAEAAANAANAATIQEDQNLLWPPATTFDPVPGGAPGAGAYGSAPVPGAHGTAPVPGAHGTAPVPGAYGGAQPAYPASGGSDPRWASERDSEQPTQDRWAAPGEPAPLYPYTPPSEQRRDLRPADPRGDAAAQRLKAEAVPTRDGTEVRLYRDSPPPAPAAPLWSAPRPDGSGQPPAAAPPGGAMPPPASAPLPNEPERLWAPPGGTPPPTATR